ncbi:MAG: glycosyltransferase family 2 protein [Odoribacter sp.]
MNTPSKVSVIIPIYNVEKYIERCIRSLFEQTLDDIEYIFVNDCTPDKSMEILQRIIAEYPQRQTQIKIIEHKKNQGSATTRNTGINAATGIYTIHCDSDDWIELDMYEKMYNKAVDEDADIVGCDFYEEHSKDRKYFKQNFPLNNVECIKNTLLGKLHSSVCNKLIKRELYILNHIHFPDGVNMWEDLTTMIQLYFYSRRISYIPNAFYYYVQYNTDSIVTNINRKQLEDTIDSCRIIEVFLKERGVFERYYMDFIERVFDAKSKMVSNSELRDYPLWQSLWPEANRYIWKYHFSFYNKIMFNLADLGLFRLVEYMLKIKLFVKK